MSDRSVLTSKWPGLSGPLVSRLLEFNLLPSRTLHPGQVDQLTPPEGMAGASEAVRHVLHRHWSKRLLNRLGANAASVIDLDEPTLPLALASPPQLMRLARDLGIALIGPSLRRIIEREQVLKARSELGEHGMGWALEGAPALMSGMEDAHSWLQAGWAQAADRLGCGMLAQAWHDAPAPIRERANWKLRPDSLNIETRTASGHTAPQARSLCLKRLNEIDPTWLLSFH